MGNHTAKWSCHDISPPEPQGQVHLSCSRPLNVDATLADDQFSLAEALPRTFAEKQRPHDVRPLQ